MSRTKRFERGSVLAWALELDGGYRASAGVEWQFAELTQGAGADGILGADVVGEELAAPEVRVSPGEEGKVKFVASERFTVLGYGEQRPIVGDSTVEVPQGSIVRLGPLLLAPLYAEQLESVREGRMELTVIPLLTGASQKDDDDSDLVAAAQVRRRIAKRWAMACGLAAALAPILSSALLYVSILDIESEWRRLHFHIDDIIGLSISQWLALFFVALPVQSP